MTPLARSLKGNAIIEWKKIAAEKIGGTKNVVARASEFTRNGVKSKDALHIACAIEGKAEYFLTTDDKLLKKLLMRLAGCGLRDRLAGRSLIY